MSDDNKPKFGVDSDPTDDDDLEDSEMDEATDDSSQFAHDKESKQTDRFGTDAFVDSQNSGSNFIERIYKLQPARFWTVQYVFSVVAFVLFYLANEQDVMFVTLIDLVLYPITATVLQEIGRLLNKKPGSIGAFIFGLPIYTERQESFTGWMIIAYYFARLVWFLTKWWFSFVIGPLGLIYMNYEAKKMRL